MKDMSNENNIILLGVIQNKNKTEKESLNNLFAQKNDWAYIAGQLLHHRLLGYFYYGLDKELFGCLDKELKKVMEDVAELNRKIYYERYECLTPVFEDFEKNGVLYAGLKGIVYPAHMYPAGIRNSGDIDILIDEKYITICDEILRKHKFVESNDKGYTEATRKEKLIQLMNYHDLVPYFNRDSFLYQNYIKIDINIHFDSKENDITKNILEEGTKVYVKDGLNIKGLALETHFLHLCVHFHREATNTLWTDKRYDVTLYKIVDILNTYNEMSSEQIKHSIYLGEKYNCYKQIYFTFYYLNVFFPWKGFDKYLKMLTGDELQFLFEIKREGKDAIEIREQSFYEKTFNLSW